MRMNLNFRQYLRKHNGFLALFLSMVLVISGSLQLVHDQLLDHHHDSDCAMYVVDGNAPAANAHHNCSIVKQPAQESSYSSVSLLVSQFQQHAARAPPISL